MMRNVTTDLALSPAHREMVARVLREQLSGVPVFAFGSRTNGTARKYSDLDLAILPPQPFSLRLLRRLREAFEDSDLPIGVDLIDLNQADADFKAAVLPRGTVVLQ
jgi:uncharacterized protein